MSALIPPNPAGDHFATTHWSVVLHAGESNRQGAGEALEQLCSTYWKPLYAYVRWQGHSPSDAQDLTQEFFARLLDKDYIKNARPERGRFRSFLLKSLQHFLVNEWVRGQAQKRGGGQQAFSIDEAEAESACLAVSAEHAAPEALFDKRWAVTLLERALGRLGSDYTAAGKAVVFEALKPVLLVAVSNGDYARLACVLGMSEGATKVALHRFRKRFREAVRQEVAQTVETPAEVDDEMRCLMQALDA